MSDSSERMYEFAYLASPELDDAGVEALRGDINGNIAKLGGSLREHLFTAKRRLAYPLGHAMNAYVVVQRILGSSEIVEKLDKVLKLEPKILRHMFYRVTERFLQRLVPPKPTAAALARRQQKIVQKIAAASPLKTTEEKKVDIAEIEKKLDEILGREL